MSELHVIILAAGQGTRMRSTRPKVLHCIAGEPMLKHVVRAALQLQPQRIHVVYGHGGSVVREQLADLAVEWVEQAEQLGTGHAVAQAMPCVPDGAQVLVLYGDVPLIEAQTLSKTVQLASDSGLSLITVQLDDAKGYGRIVRDSQGRTTGIVEHKDATCEQLKISEGNTGILATRADSLRRWLTALNSNNAQGEFYLTDVIAMAAAENLSIETVQPQRIEEVLGVNDRVQLASLERVYQLAQAERLMRDGASMADPSRVDVRGEVTTGNDVWIDVNVVMEGRVHLDDGASIGPNVTLRDCRIGANAQIFANCVIDDASVGAGAKVGPFARLRPGATLSRDVHVGNFVEVKNTTLGEGSKANHLSYLGDSDIGAGVNVGAGTITCNYDGANKHRTTIGDGAFIGSGVELVAPITVEAGATIGAGSTITRDAPADQLTLTRAKQATIRSWKRPQKKPSK
ncbi:MAG: bifunctional UDP-N-acetylglucosamine pyrophosphorylase/glucosamine-1-phosphate N-acetyltransferase [Gammaproteobacteria bacterium]|jgi:bifunctional UDP-N-acetylglucosamine pyrophosphorylase/glucosamine-1-phosphate N-acetyltransferase